MSKPEYAIGIDIGGTNTEFGVVDEKGNILSRGSISTKAHEKVEDFIDALYKAIQPAVESIGGTGNIKGIGIGAPNANIYRGTIEHAANLSWKGVIPFAQMITDKCGLPTTLTNDANAAALGEMIYGAAKGVEHFIMITLGTGVGSGIVIDGKVVYGHDGFAGELGHTIIVPNGRKHWSTGALGSLEAYASATGVRETALELLEKYPEQHSRLRNYTKEELNSRVVHSAALEGDEIAKEVLRFTGEILGNALANFVMFSSPEMIVLFGGLSKAGDMILRPTKEHMEAHVLPIFKDKVRIVLSELREADAAILGASALVWGRK